MEVKMFCPCCHETHTVFLEKMREKGIFKQQPIEYDAEYYHCYKTNEYFMDEQLRHKRAVAIEQAYGGDA